MLFGALIITCHLKCLALLRKLLEVRLSALLLLSELHTPASHGGNLISRLVTGHMQQRANAAALCPARLVSTLVLITACLPMTTLP